MCSPAMNMSINLEHTGRARFRVEQKITLTLLVSCGALFAFYTTSRI